jgi:hypothetical protein
LHFGSRGPVFPFYAQLSCHVASPEKERSGQAEKRKGLSHPPIRASFIPGVFHLPVSLSPISPLWSPESRFFSQIYGPNASQTIISKLLANHPGETATLWRYWNFASPIEALDSSNCKEAEVRVQKRKIMLATERCAPEVIRWNGLSRLLLRPGSRSHMACSLLFVHLSLKPRTGHLLEVQCRISMDLVVRRKFLTKFCSPDQ